MSDKDKELIERAWRADLNEIDKMILEAESDEAVRMLETAWRRRYHYEECKCGCA